MDFLYAFKEAKSLGISAEEFCRMWEKEAFLKRASMLRNRKAGYNKLLNVEDASNNLNSPSDVELEHSEQVKIVKCNIEELKSVGDETKDCMFNLKRDISNCNKDFVDKSMEFLCRQHLLIEKLNRQVDAINSELVNIKSKVIQGHDVKTERMEGQIANLQQEVINMSQTFVNHIESSESISPTQPTCASEISVTKETAFNSIVSLKTPHILNATNQTDVKISVDYSKTSFTSPESHSNSTISEGFTGNFESKFTGALSFLSNFVPKLVHGALSVLKDCNESNDSSVSLHPGDKPSFTNCTMSGSSVDINWSAGQSSIDTTWSVGQSSLDTTGFVGLSSGATACSVEDSSNQSILVDHKLVNLQVSTNEVNSIQLKNNFDSLAAEGVEADIFKDQQFYASNKSSNCVKTLTNSDTLIVDEKKRKNSSTKADDGFNQVSETVTDTKSVSIKFQEESTLTQLNNANSALHPSQESSLKKPICNLGDNYTTESNLKKYSNTIVSKPQDTLLYLIPNSGVYFYMSSKQILHQSSKTFYTSLYTTQEKCLKVRLCQYFDERGHLCVYVLVSGGQADRMKKSITLAGEGSIYCGLVGGYTTSRIWRLKAFQFHNMDEPQEFSVKANVCLVEKKGSHKPVTFKQLVRRGYDYDGYFIFNWWMKIVNTK